MFSRGSLRLRFFLAPLLLLTGCASRSPNAPAKFAVLRFENLSPDTSSDWVGRALSEILSKKLGGPSLGAMQRAQQPFALRPAAAPGVSSEAAAALLFGATETITGYFTAVNGTLSVTAFDASTATGKTLRTLNAKGDLLSVTDALAKEVTASPKTFSTRNLNALRLYSVGLESDKAEAPKFLEQAVAADPNFSDAYLAWTAAAAAINDRPDLDRALAAAAARGNGLPPLDRALLNLEAATLHQDVNARLAALTEIAKLNPGDPAQIKALADAEVSTRRLKLSIEHYRQAIALKPDDADLHNLLAYAKMFAGDSTGALESVRMYQKLKPQDPNAFDSEGDIHFYFGKFGKAERLYLQSYSLSAGFNAGVDGWKAARARLMTGDVAGATQLFQKFRAARLKAADPSIAFRDAEWQYAIGQRTPAVAAMLSAAQSAANPELRSLCFTQAAIWELAAGYPAQAATHAGMGAQTASPQTGAIAGIVRFLAQGKHTAAEWRALADRQIGGTGAAKFRDLAAAYAYLFAHDFSAAVPAWSAIYQDSNPADQGPTFLYAWSLIEAGQSSLAAPLVQTNPIPPPAPAVSFETLYFPSLFAWRGDQATFLKLGGTATPAK